MIWKKNSKNNVRVNQIKKSKYRNKAMETIIGDAMATDVSVRHLNTLLLNPTLEWVLVLGKISTSNTVKTWICYQNQINWIVETEEYWCIKFISRKLLPFIEGGAQGLNTDGYLSNGLSNIGSVFMSVGWQYHGVCLALPEIRTAKDKKRIKYSNKKEIKFWEANFPFQDK